MAKTSAKFTAEMGLLSEAKQIVVLPLAMMGAMIEITPSKG